MNQHQNSVHYSINGQWQDGTTFNVAPSWWQEAGKSIKALVERLERPCLGEFDEGTNRHREYSRKVKYVEIIEYRSTRIADYGARG